MKLQLGNIFANISEFKNRLIANNINLNFELPDTFNNQQVSLFFEYIIEDILSGIISLKVFDYNFDELMAVNHVLNHLNNQDIKINFYSTGIENNIKALSNKKFTDQFDFSEVGRKVKFTYHSKILGQVVNERLWCSIIDKEKGIYQLNNIPFFGMNFSLGDKIKVFEIEGEGLIMEELHSRSGNTTAFVIIEPYIDFKKLLNQLQFKKFDYEIGQSRFIVVNIDYDKNINEFIEILTKINIEEKCFTFSCLSNKHKKELL